MLQSISETYLPDIEKGDSGKRGSGEEACWWYILTSIVCFIRWFSWDIHNDKVPADWVGGGVPYLLVLAPIQVDATLSPILAVEAGKVDLVDYWHFE